MEKKSKLIVVSVVASILGLIAIILAFVAEGTKIKADQVEYYTDDGTCIYPSSASFGLGIVASIILLIEQILISSATGCFCCRRAPCPKTCRGIISLVCFIFSWLIFIGAFVMLVDGGVLNNGKALGKKYKAYDGCPIGKSGLFVGGGVLALVSVTLGIVSVLMTWPNPGTASANASNLANESAAPPVAKAEVPSN